MTIDPYQYCPCGGEKKIKFCCSKDIVPEIEKVLRAIQGEQRVSALDSLNKLIKEHGERLALLALKAEVQLALEQTKDAEKTITKFLEAAPYNSVALALSAIMETERGNLEAAVEQLQRGVEYVEQLFPEALYSAIGVVAQALLQSGDVLAARGHYLMQAGIVGDRDQTPVTILTRINMLPELPQLLKQDPAYAECPHDVPWRGEFNAALKSARRGAWLAACESLTSLSQKVPGQPAILRNIAILRGWLGQREEMLQHWREYARHADVPWDDRVEAEALAQLLDPASATDALDDVLVSYPVKNTDELMEKLLTHKCIAKAPVDPAEFAEEGQPPPKAVFWLLDKPVPASGIGITRDTLPNVLGDLYVFGKQTDRPARLELSITRDAAFEAGKQSIVEIAGDCLSGAPSETVEGQVSRVATALQWRWRMPDDTPPEQRAKLIEEQQQEVLMNRWPELPLAVLGGKTPRQAAADPAKQVAVQAALLLLELADEDRGGKFDFNALRRSLNLATREPIAPADVDALLLPIVRVRWVDVEKISDEGLLTLYRRSVLKQAHVAVRHVAAEVLRREHLSAQIDREETYEVLIRVARDSAQALEYIERAKAEAAAKRQSPARWLLAELSIRLMRMEGEAATRLLQTLQSRHLNEPGISQALYELLVGYGVIAPDGKPRPVGEAHPGPAVAAEPPAAPAAASKLWTPESAAAAAGEQKSKLWIPGMD